VNEVERAAKLQEALKTMSADEATTAQAILDVLKDATAGMTQASIFLVIALRAAHKQGNTLLPIQPGIRPLGLTQRDYESSMEQMLLHGYVEARDSDHGVDIYVFTPDELLENGVLKTVEQRDALAELVGAGHGR
jgi:hypothetical protein